MPYAPGISYHGDQYLYQAISGVGRDLAEGIKRFRESRKQAKETDATLESIGGTTANLVKQGLLDPSLLEQFNKVASGPAEAKQGFIKGLGQSLQMMANAAQLQNLKADNERADKYLAIQTAQNDRAVASEKAREEFGKLVQRYLSPIQGPTVGGMPTVMGRQLTPEIIARFAAQTGSATPEQMMDALSRYRPQQTKEQFMPQIVDLGNGNQGMTTSPSSAVPLPRPKAETKKAMPAPVLKMINDLKSSRAREQAILDSAQAEIDAGNKKSGPDWGWGETYSSVVSASQRRLKELDAQIKALDGGGELAKERETEPATTAAGESMDPEMKQAQEAIQRGADPTAVAKRYKERTGKDLY